MGMEIYNNPRYWLVRIINYFEPEIAKKYYDLWQNQQAAVTYKDIRAMIQQSIVDESLVYLWNKDYVKMVNEQVGPVIKKAIQKTVDAVINQNKKWAFNPTDQVLQKWVGERAAKLVADITEGQRQALANLIQLGTMPDAITVDELSRVIRPTIGLTKNEAKAVYNYYNTIRGEGGTNSYALKRATTYTERLKRKRGSRIARTELAFAYNEAADTTIREAQKFGYIGDVLKEWITSGDERVCVYCQELNGTRVEMHQMFVDSIGRAVEVPPLHPYCRCAVKYIEREDINNGILAGAEGTGT